MAKKGFKGQWVEISRAGKHKDNLGIERDLNTDFLKKVVANFQAHNSPITIGHPGDNAPAWGWATELRLMSNGALEAQFADTDDEFEQMCADGKFRKRSASFYLDPPKLKHVGFLGAAPPAIKGLRDINFTDGDSVTVEISFSEEILMKDEEVEKVAGSVFDKLKGLFGGGQPAPSVVPPNDPSKAPAATASFNEVDVQKLIDTALKANTETLTASFNEKYAALETKVGSISGKGRRAEIDAFVETIPAESGRHYLKNIGVAEFMEACANADDSDTEKAVVCFSEASDGKKEEHKFSRLEWAKTYFSSLPATISFGEKFGNIVTTAEADLSVDHARMKQINDAIGLKEGDE